jgi:tRNA modification GTPase
LTGILTSLPTSSIELLTVDLREALQLLGEITGETTPDEILDLIFSQFCVGK